MTRIELTQVPISFSPAVGQEQSNCLKSALPGGRIPFTLFDLQDPYSPKLHDLALVIANVAKELAQGRDYFGEGIQQTLHHAVMMIDLISKATLLPCLLIVLRDLLVLEE